MITITSSATHQVPWSRWSIHPTQTIPSYPPFPITSYPYGSKAPPNIPPNWYAASPRRQSRCTIRNHSCWNAGDAYLAEKKVSEDNVDPNDFIVWGYRKLLENRLPRYREIAQKWGVTVQASDVARVKSTDDFNALIATALKG